MGNTVIKVEGLGKSFVIGSKQNQSFSLIESLTNAFKDPFRRLKNGSRSANSAPGTEFWALRDICFEVNHGETLGIIGRNGSGKSTLLKILSRVLQPTKGRCTMYGRCGSLLEVGMGFHPELTGRENIYLNGAILGLSKVEIDKRFDGIVDFSGIEKFIDTPVKRYSSGMYVRLAFAIAAQMDSEILVIDEVLSVGDLAFQKKCLARMHEVATEGRTVLFVSHSMDSVRQFCGRCIMLQEGRLVEDGPTDKVVDRYLDLVYEEIGNTVETEKLEDVPRLISRLPNDPVFRLHDIEVIQNGHSTLRAHNGSPIEVKIEYEVLQETKGLFVFLSLFSHQGQLVFESLHNGAAEGVPIVKPGKYVSTGVIPADLLAPITYELGVSAAIYGVRACLPDMIKLKLSVAAAGRANRAYQKRRVSGQIAPLIEWRTEPSDARQETASPDAGYVHTATFEDEETAPICIRKICIKDENGQPSALFNLSGRISLSIDYLVRRNLAGSMIILAVARDGVYLFQSHDTDLAPELLTTRESGAYSSSVCLPRRFLAPGMYMVTATVTVGPLGENYHRAYRNVLRFKVDTDGEDVTFKSYSPNRGLMIMAELEWQISRKDSLEPAS